MLNPNYKAEYFAVTLIVNEISLIVPILILSFRR
jgi:hypothetical protein